jgi:hypothetical protein
MIPAPNTYLINKYGLRLRNPAYYTVLVYAKGLTEDNPQTEMGLEAENAVLAYSIISIIAYLEFQN